MGAWIGPGSTEDHGDRAHERTNDPRGAAGLRQRGRRRGPPAARARRRHRDARRMPARGRRASPCATSAAIATSRCPGGVHRPTAPSIVDDPTIDIVCELLGGIEPARALILRAFANGKSVVTANKELLANDGEELFEAADAAGRRPLLRGVGGRRDPVDPVR